MGIWSPATSVRTNDGNCECFLLEGGGGRRGGMGHSVAWYWMVLVRPQVIKHAERTSLFVTEQIFLLS